jgi:hypothetical protein
MEIEARRQSDKKVEALESCLDNMQQLLEKLLQQQINPSSTPNGSNSSAHVVTGHSFVLYIPLFLMQ